MPKFKIGDYLELDYRHSDFYSKIIYSIVTLLESGKIGRERE